MGPSSGLGFWMFDQVCRTGIAYPRPWTFRHGLAYRASSLRQRLHCIPGEDGVAECDTQEAHCFFLDCVVMAAVYGGRIRECVLARLW
jgi:hypothetical protein